MGSPEFAATILSHLASKFGPPVAVVTQEAKQFGRGQRVKGTAVEELAKKNHWAVLATSNINTPEALTFLKSYSPDVIVVAAFGQILKEEVLNLPKYCLNVHASILPKYRGAAPIQRSIEAGDTETGVAIQRMVRKLDAGDLGVVKKIQIDPKDNCATLTEKLAVLGGEGAAEALSLIQNGTISFAPQDEKRATHAGKMTKEEAVIRWERGAKEIWCQIRALNPWPVAETLLGGERLKIFEADVVDTKGRDEPGTLHTDGISYLHVGTGDGRAVSLTQIQLENRKRLGIKDFLNAYRGKFPYKKVG